MLPDRVSNPGPLTYESGALPIVLLGPAISHSLTMVLNIVIQWSSVFTSGLRPDFTSNFVHELAFGTQKFYIVPYGKINHRIDNLSYMGPKSFLFSYVTVIILNIGTDRSEQTVQTQIRLLHEEQSDQGLLCLLFCLHLLSTILHCKIQLFQL